jgi:hypothetical protein
MLSVVMTWDSVVEGCNVLGAEFDVITSVSLDGTGNNTTTPLFLAFFFALLSGIMHNCKRQWQLSLSSYYRVLFMVL